MATITETLTTEHALLNRLFDELERLLPDLRTVPEVQLLTRVLTGLLTYHADLEENLAYAALDHAVAEQGQLDRLYQDHHEIDLRLRAVASATELLKATQLLKAGLKASREHFKHEERVIFPLLAKHLSPTALQTLGAGAGDATAPLGLYGFANALSARLRPRPAATSSQGG
jgi:hemerythrin-like domain-containing protein